MNELLVLLRHTIDNFSSSTLLAGRAEDLAPPLDAIPDDWAKLRGRWVKLVLVYTEDGPSWVMDD